MDSLKIILFSGLAFNLGLVVFIILQVRRSKAKQEHAALSRRKQILEQGKIIIAQESLLKSKQELLNEKEELINVYRKNID